jgi:hypothetical protein
MDPISPALAAWVNKAYVFAMGQALFDPGGDLIPLFPESNYVGPLGPSPYFGQTTAIKKYEFFNILNSVNPDGDSDVHDIIAEESHDYEIAGRGYDINETEWKTKEQTFTVVGPPGTSEQEMLQAIKATGLTAPKLEQFNVSLLATAPVYKVDPTGTGQILIVNALPVNVVANTKWTVTVRWHALGNVIDTYTDYEEDTFVLHRNGLKIAPAFGSWPGTISSDAAIAAMQQDIQQVIDDLIAAHKDPAAPATFSEPYNP